MNAHLADETGRRTTVFPPVYRRAQAPEQAQQRGWGVLDPAMNEVASPASPGAP